MYNNYKYYLSFARMETSRVIESGLVDSTTEITKRFGSRMITYYKLHGFRLFEPDSWAFCLYLSEKSTKVCVEIGQLRSNFTEDSIKRTLCRYPTILKLCFELGDLRAIYVGENRAYLWTHINGDSVYVNKRESQCVQKLLNVVGAFESECDCFKYTPDLLELTEWKKQEIKYEIERKKNPQPQNNSNTKVERYLKIAAIIGLKYIVRSIGANLDLPIPSDSSDAPDFTDIPDLPDLPDADGSDCLGNLDFVDTDNSYGLSFMGKDTLPAGANSDGYIPDGSISLTRTISDIAETFKHYRKDGHDYVLYNGSYYRVDGSGTVRIGGILYDKK